MYNQLPMEIKGAGSIGHFREVVNKWLKDMDNLIFQ